MYSLYILICDEGKHYIGVTDTLERRISEHNDPDGKKIRYTRRYTNWRMIYTETYSTLSEARKREYEIKSWKWGNKFRQLIAQSDE